MSLFNCLFLRASSEPANTLRFSEPAKRCGFARPAIFLFPGKDTWLPTVALFRNAGNLNRFSSANENSAALLGREPGLHQIQGIGDGFIPDVLDLKLVDMVFTVSDEEAIETTRKLSKEEGLLVGTSSGANVFAALHMDNGRNKVVTILPDRVERYFSTALL